MNLLSSKKGMQLGKQWEMWLLNWQIKFASKNKRKWKDKNKRKNTMTCTFWYMGETYFTSLVFLNARQVNRRQILYPENYTWISNINHAIWCHTYLCSMLSSKYHPSPNTLKDMKKSIILKFLRVSAWDQDKQMNIEKEGNELNEH